MTTEPLRAILLAAVSAKDQAEDDKFSLDAQVSDGMAAAAKNGWTVTDVIRIEGHSRNYRTLAQLAEAEMHQAEGLPAAPQFLHWTARSSIHRLRSSTPC